MTEKQLDEVRDKLIHENNKFKDAEIEKIDAYHRGYTDCLYDFRVEVEKLISDESKEDINNEQN